MADLLGSILSSMDKPPTQSERERKAAKELRAEQEKVQAVEKRTREEFRKKIMKQMSIFMEDGTKKRMKFSPMNKVYRAIIHEVAETAGIMAHSFGEEEVDRYIMLFKKEHAPSDEELQALRKGEEYDPQKVPVNVPRQQPVAAMDKLTPTTTSGANYIDKYRHLIGSEVEGPSAIKMEPGRNFGFVPGANKRDVRSIEETLKDIKSKKKAKLMTEEQDDNHCND